MMDLEVGSILYLISGICALILAAIFYKSKDGWLRKSMILIFLGYGIGLFLRAFVEIFNLGWEGIGFYIILLPFLSLFFGTGYIFQKYIRNKF